MKLQEFFPYRLAGLSEAVSQSIAQVYRERFGPTRDEWRVLAALADAGHIKTGEVIARTTLEKMQVSRAVARLERDGLIGRSTDPGDGRAYVLRLLPPGRALYLKIVPMVQAREQYLLAALQPDERLALDKALSSVQRRAEELARRG